MTFSHEDNKYIPRLLVFNLISLHRQTSERSFGVTIPSNIRNLLNEQNELKREVIYHVYSYVVPNPVSFSFSCPNHCYQANETIEIKTEINKRFQCDKSAEVKRKFVTLKCSEFKYVKIFFSLKQSANLISVQNFLVANSINNSKQ